MWRSESLLRRAVALAVAPLIVGGIGVIAQTALASGPLRIHPTNPRYFTDGSRIETRWILQVLLTS